MSPRNMVIHIETKVRIVREMITLAKELNLFILSLKISMQSKRLRISPSHVTWAVQYEVFIIIHTEWFLVHMLNVLPAGQCITSENNPFLQSNTNKMFLHVVFITSYASENSFAIVLISTYTRMLLILLNWTSYFLIPASSHRCYYKSTAYSAYTCPKLCTKRLALVKPTLGLYAVCYMPS